MGKKMISVLLASMVGLMTVGCASDGQAVTEIGGNETKSASASTTIKIAFNQSESHPQYKTLTEFGEKLETETDGAYEVEIYPNALLGDQRATIELVQNGSIQMSIVGNPLVENYNKDFAVIGLPYVYDSQEHQKAVFQSDILDELFASTAGEGFQTVAAFTAGARNIYADKPITTPEDLKGYKVRVMESDTMVNMLNLMGGVGTPMAQSEVYTAIQQGVLEGGENNEITYVDLKHYEVAPYFSYTQHLMVPDLLIMNTDLLNSMSKEHREVFDKLVDEAVEVEFKLWEEEVQTAKQIAEQNGTTFVDVDIKPFQENCLPLHESVTSQSDTTKALYDEVRKLSK